MLIIDLLHDRPITVITSRRHSSVHDVVGVKVSRIKAPLEVDRVERHACKVKNAMCCLELKALKSGKSVKTDIKLDAL